ncbi:MAG TPA: hypothetical protein VF154_16655, partial [Terriglobales bacterium]
MTTSSFHYPDASTWNARARRVLIFCVAFLLPASQLAAQTASPMLYPKGEVLVDGRDTSGPIALFAGDKVQTG